MSAEELTPKIVPCKYCGKDIPESATFCWYCGRELIARPERPDIQPSRKVSSATLLVILVLLAVFTAFMLWPLYAH